MVCNFKKKEWVLNNDSVIYASYEMIEDSLKYDFSLEKDFSYRDLSEKEIVSHLSRFISYIWQIHPFIEGNTRTISVFFIKYLKFLGFNVKYETFAGNSWYLRNALVRANYNNYEKKVFESYEYLEMFLYNLLFNKKYDLNNRDLHIDEKSKFKDYSKLNLSLEEKSVLMLLSDNPNILLSRISSLTGKSLRTVKNYVSNLKEKGLIERVNGKKKGKWIVKC